MGDRGARGSFTPGPGPGSGDRRVHPAQARALRPGGHSPCSGGGGSAPAGPGHPAAARRPAPDLPRPAPQPGPRPGAAPSARPRHSGPVRNPRRRAPRCSGGGCPGALPLRGRGGSGRPAHFRSGRTRGGEAGRAEVGELGYRAQQQAGQGQGWLRADRERRCGWACGSGATSSLGLQSPPQPHGGALDCRTRSLRPAARLRVGGWLPRSSSESARPGSSMNTGKGKCLPQGGRA